MYSPLNPDFHSGPSHVAATCPDAVPLSDTDARTVILFWFKVNQGPGSASLIGEHHHPIERAPQGLGFDSHDLIGFRQHPFVIGEATGQLTRHDRAMPMVEEHVVLVHAEHD